MDTVMTIKGQVVIPAKIRKQLEIKQGTRFSVEERDGDIILHPIDKAYFKKMKGILKGGGLLKSLEMDRKREKEREEAKLGKK